MRPSRLRGSIGEWMIAVALSGVLLVAVAEGRRERQSRRLLIGGAKAVYENARLTREVAEIAVIEYKEGVYRQEIQTVKGEMALAEAEQKRAVDRLAWSDRMREKGYVSISCEIPDPAQARKFFVDDQTVRELQRDVEKARADELLYLKVYEQARAGAGKLLW